MIFVSQHPDSLFLVIFFVTWCSGGSKHLVFNIVVTAINHRASPALSLYPYNCQRLIRRLSGPTAGIQTLLGSEGHETSVPSARVREDKASF